MCSNIRYQLNKMDCLESLFRMNVSFFIILPLSSTKDNLKRVTNGESNLTNCVVLVTNHAKATKNKRHSILKTIKLHHLESYLETANYKTPDFVNNLTETSDVYVLNSEQYWGFKIRVKTFRSLFIKITLKHRNGMSYWTLWEKLVNYFSAQNTYFLFF